MPHRVALHLARRPVSAALLALLLYIALAVLLFHSAWSAPGSTTVGTRGDADATIWYHAWARYAVAHGVSPLLSDHLGFPTGVNLTWQTSQPLTGWLSWPVAAGFGPYAAYDVVATLALALSAWCAFLVLRRWVASRAGAWLGGLVYGFSPYMAAHSLGHLNLVTAVVPPLLLAVLDEVLVRQRRSWWRSGALLGVLAVVQLLVAEELLATEALMAAFGVALLAVLHRDAVRARAGHAVRALAVGLVVFLAGGSWMLWVQATGPLRLGGTFQHPGGFSSDLLGFVVPTAVQQVQPDAALRIARTFTGNISEQNAYVSVPLLLVIVLTVWRHRRVAWVRVVAALGAIAAVLSMGPTLHVAGRATHLPLPWVVFEHLPLLANLVPARLMVYAFLAAGLLLAQFVGDVMAAWPAGPRTFGLRNVRVATGAAVLVGATLVALLPRVDFPASPHDDPPFFLAGGDVARIPAGASVLVAPFVASGADVDPEVWQVRSDMRFRMPSGYYLQPDPAHRDTHLLGPVRRPLSQAMLDVYDGRGAPPLTAAVRSRMVEDLAYWRTRAVIVGPMPHRDDMVAMFIALLGRSPQQDQGVAVWWDVQPEALRAASAAMSWSNTYTSKRS